MVSEATVRRGAKEIKIYSYYYEMASRLLDKGNLIIAIGVDASIGEAHFHVFRNEADFKAWKRGACL